MEIADYQAQARNIVHAYVSSRQEPTNVPGFEVFLVWFSKTLKNWKALAATTLPDQHYFEITHNGETGETYLDVYVKVDNVCIKDGLPIREVVSHTVDYVENARIPIVTGRPNDAIASIKTKPSRTGDYDFD